MELEKELGVKVFDVYQRSIFGKVSKYELDLLVFGFLVKDFFKNDITIFNGAQINWFKLTSHHMRQLAFKFKLTETKVAILLEQAAIFELSPGGSENIVVNEILFLLKNTKQSVNDLKVGKVKLYIPNRITKNAISNYLAINNSIPDYSFNNNVMVVRVIDLIPISQQDKYLIEIEKMFINSKEFEDNSDVKNFVELLSRKSKREKVISLSSDSLKYFLQSGRDYFMESFFELLKATITAI